MNRIENVKGKPGKKLQHIKQILLMYNKYVFKIRKKTSRKINNSKKFQKKKFERSVNIW